MGVEGYSIKSKVVVERVKHVGTGEVDFHQRFGFDLCNEERYEKCCKEKRCLRYGKKELEDESAKLFPLCQKVNIVFEANRKITIQKMNVFGRKVDKKT